MRPLYRRHIPECPFSGKPRDARGAKACKAACPIFVWRLRSRPPFAASRNPNPTREGCPSRDVLAALARREGSMEDPGYEHLAKCSPCFKDFRAVQQADVARTAAVRQRRRIAYAAAAAFAVVGSLFVVWRSRGPRAVESPTGVKL
jgi:hypothetical protein